MLIKGLVTALLIALKPTSALLHTPGFFFAQSPQEDLNININVDDLSSACASTFDEIQSGIDQEQLQIPDQLEEQGEIGELFEVLIEALPQIFEGLEEQILTPTTEEDTTTSSSQSNSGTLENSCFGMLFSVLTVLSEDFPADIPDFPADILAVPPRGEPQQSKSSSGRCTSAFGGIKALARAQVKKQNPERAAEAEALSHEGLLQILQGNQEEGNELFEQASEIYQSLDDNSIPEHLVDEAELIEQGVNHFHKKEYEKSIVFFQESLKSDDLENDQFLTAYVLNYLGDSHLAQDDFDNAVEAYEKSLFLSKEIQCFSLEHMHKLASIHFENAQQLSGLSGETFQSKQAVSNSEQLLTEILKFFHPREDSQLTRGQFSTRGGSIELVYKASHLLQKVLVSQGKTDDALVIAEKIRSAESEKILFDVGFLGEGKRTISVEEGIARSSNKEFPLIAYVPTISDLKQVARSEDATIVYYSNISPAEIYIWVIQPNGEIEFEISNPETVGISSSKINDLSNDAENNEEAAGFIPDRGEQDVALAQFLRGTRDASGVREFGDDEVSILDEQEQSERHQKLYDLLIEPIESFLPDNPEDHIVFVPEGHMLFVPFPALERFASGNRSYLVDHHTIRTVQNLQTLRLNSINRAQLNWGQGIPTSENILVVGNPKAPSLQLFDSDSRIGLGALPGAEAEAKSIASLFETEAILEDYATETTVKSRMPSANIIHLAAHGVLDEIDLPTPEGNIAHSRRITNSSFVPGAIVLAESTQDDGLLTAYEIVEESLNANLVVMSACNTGLGNLRGSTATGLPFALVGAGVPSVVVSLWAVSDESTSEQMTIFYEELFAQNQTGEPIDIAKALRNSMLEIKAKEEYKNPRYWSAFTLMGAAD